MRKEPGSYTSSEAGKGGGWGASVASFDFHVKAIEDLAFKK